MKKYPLILLHGWNLNKINLIPLENELSRRGFRLFNIDLPGFGKESLTAENMYLAGYKDFVLKFCREKKLKKIILIGHSFGGRIGIKLATSNPELFHALILSGTPAVSSVPSFKRFILTGFAKFGKQAFRLPVISSYKIPARKILGKLLGIQDYYATPQALKQTFRNIVSEKLEDMLAQIKTPTLLIWGENDSLVPLKIGKIIQQKIKNARLIILKGRHGIPWTNKKEFADAVESFVNSV